MDSRNRCDREDRQGMREEDREREMRERENRRGDRDDSRESSRP